MATKARTAEKPATASEVNEALQDLEKIAQQWAADFPRADSSFRPAQAFGSAMVAPSSTASRHRPKGQSRKVTMGVAAAVVGLIVFRGLSALLSSNSSGKSEIAPSAAPTPMQPENTLRYANGDIFEGNIINGKANDPQR